MISLPNNHIQLTRSMAMVPLISMSLKFSQSVNNMIHSNCKLEKTRSLTSNHLKLSSRTQKKVNHARRIFHLWISLGSHPLSIISKKNTHQPWFLLNARLPSHILFSSKMSIRSKQWRDPFCLMSRWLTIQSIWKSERSKFVYKSFKNNNSIRKSTRLELLLLAPTRRRNVNLNVGFTLRILKLKLAGRSSEAWVTERKWEALLALFWSLKLKRISNCLVK